MSDKAYSSDHPVMEEKDDRFSRWGFSEGIAKVISKRKDSSSIVIGLYGDWGAGKTSVLNFIKESLKDDDGGVICIQFNPWRFDNEEVLLSGFFHEIASALGEKLVHSGDKIKNLLKEITSDVDALFPMAGVVGKSVSAFISSVDLEKLKKRIETLLKKSDKRVLVLIDDVDRLEKTEIHALFRLVKLTANFQNIAYILAFDKDIVAASLQDRYPNSSGNAGEAFLEKIIQVPLHLPSIEKETLRKFCFEGVEEALDLAKITLSDQQTQEFVYCFKDAFDDSLTTPRKAKLYRNTLLFSLPLLKGKVNPVDLMLLEGIRVFCPPLYDTIRQNKDVFLRRVFLRRRRKRGHSDFSAQKELEEVVEEALSSTKNINKSDFLNLLTTMFPQLELFFDEAVTEVGLVYNDSLQHLLFEKWDKDQRICSADYFSRYFMDSIPESDISDQAITSLIQKAENWEAPFDEMDNPLNAYLTSKNFDLLLQKLSSRSKEISQDGSKSLVVAFARKPPMLPNPTISHYQPNISIIGRLYSAAELIEKLIQKLAIADREKWACTSIQECPDIDFKLTIFHCLFLRKKNQNKLESKGFSQEAIERIGKLLSQEIISELDSKGDITSVTSNHVSKAFDILDTYHKEGYSAAYFEEAAKKDPSIVSRVLYSIVPALYGGTFCTYFKSNFERKEYNTVASVLNPSFIMELIQEHYPEACDKLEEYPKNAEDSSTDEALCLKQFVWMHRYVLKEKSSDLSLASEKNKSFDGEVDES